MKCYTLNQLNKQFVIQQKAGGEERGSIKGRGLIDKKKGVYRGFTFVAQYPVRSPVSSTGVPTSLFVGAHLTRYRINMATVYLNKMIRLFGAHCEEMK